MEYREISFVLFLTERSLESLRDFGRKLKTLFHEHYSAIGFSEDKFMEVLAPLYVEYDPHRNVYYDFDLSASGREENWRLRLRLTQIGNVEGGIIRSGGFDASRLGMARELVERRLASLVTIVDFESGKGLNRLVGAPRSITYLGRRSAVYVWLKIETRTDLLNRFRWEKPTLTEAFDFSKFFSAVETLLDNQDNTSIVEVKYGEELDSFLAECDETLRSKMSPEAIDELLGLISTHSAAWLGQT